MLATFFTWKNTCPYTISLANSWFSKFKDILWQKRIQQFLIKKNNTHLKGKNCFLQLAGSAVIRVYFFHRSALRSQYIIPAALDEISSSTMTGRIFYYPWYLWSSGPWKNDRKRIYRSSSSIQFFELIGSSLSWGGPSGLAISEISRSGSRIKLFIEEVLRKMLSFFLKEELLISILLSDYCIWFFSTFEKIIDSKRGPLFKKIIFLLRTACKEVDSTFKNHPVL